MDSVMVRVEVVKVWRNTTLRVLTRKISHYKVRKNYDKKQINATFYLLHFSSLP